MQRGIWRELSRANSESNFTEYCLTKQFQCPDEYKEMREEILKVFQETLFEIGITETQIGNQNNSYKVDYIFGLKIYCLLTDKYNVNVRLAANEGFWRFLSLKVVPDVIEKRYGINHPDRFWKKPKRVWLRVLWWYIYLSWQGTTEKTANVLADNSTDEILQLVDRCGRGGYRVELYRAIMRKYSQLDIQERRRSQIFRKMMVLNTARVQVVEPAFSCNGENGYVDELYNYFVEG